MSKVEERLREAVRACVRKYGTLQGSGYLEFKIHDHMLAAMSEKIALHDVQAMVAEEYLNAKG